MNFNILADGAYPSVAIIPGVPVCDATARIDVVPFTLPDLRPPAPPLKQQTAMIPMVRPSLSREELFAQLNAENTWFSPLTHKQRRFVLELFSNGFDTEKAVALADPTIPPHERRRAGRRWRDLKSIKTAIDAVYALYEARSMVRFQDLVEELRLIAFSNIIDYVDPVDADPRGLDDTDYRWRAVKKIVRRPTKYGDEITYELHSKIDAVALLGKFFGPKGEAKNDSTPDATQPPASVSVQTINIIPVPQGSFLPPQAPDGEQITPVNVIDGQVVDRASLPRGVS